MNPHTYDLERGTYDGFSGLTAKQLAAASEEADRILGNLTKAWASLYARAVVAKDAAKVEVTKAKAAIDALRTAPLNDEASIAAWGKSAAEVAGRLQGLAVGLADAQLASALASTDPVGDLTAALSPSTSWWIIGGIAVAAAIFVVPKLLKSFGKGMADYSEYEPENDLY